MKTINSFDLDGVISIGIHPGPNDVIITGRSFEEAEETYKFLHARGIYNAVFFNPSTFDKKSRITSGQHKAEVIYNLFKQNICVISHFEDDEVQIEQIEQKLKGIYDLNIIHISHNLTEKENVRHDSEGNIISKQS